MEKEIVYNIVCNGEDCVAVKMKNAVHFMTLKEWKWVYGQLHPERWERSKRDINEKQKK